MSLRSPFPLEPLMVSRMVVVIVFIWISQGNLESARPAPAEPSTNRLNSTWTVPGVKPFFSFFLRDWFHWSFIFSTGKSCFFLKTFLAGSWFLKSRMRISPFLFQMKWNWMDEKLNGWKENPNGCRGHEDRSNKSYESYRSWKSYEPSIVTSPPGRIRGVDPISLSPIIFLSPV